MIDILDIKGSTVTTDAMGCQKQIAAKIIEKNADYVLGLKGNQPSLYQDLKLYFESELPQSTIRTLEKDHGRIEKREYYLETDVDWITQRADWVNLQGICYGKSLFNISACANFRADFSSNKALCRGNTLCISKQSNAVWRKIRRKDMRTEILNRLLGPP